LITEKISEVIKYFKIRDALLQAICKKHYVKSRLIYRNNLLFHNLYLLNGKI